MALSSSVPRTRHAPSIAAATSSPLRHSIRDLRQRRNTKQNARTGSSVSASVGYVPTGPRQAKVAMEALREQAKAPGRYEVHPTEQSALIRRGIQVGTICRRRRRFEPRTGKLYGLSPRPDTVPRSSAGPGTDRSPK
jgi:hypothetical protein